MKTRLLISLVMVVSCSSVFAQWTSVPQSAVPRTADGKPNLSAPAPRLPDGKPVSSAVDATLKG